jgi:hypothetical protein
MNLFKIKNLRQFAQIFYNKHAGGLSVKLSPMVDVVEIIGR